LISQPLCVLSKKLSAFAVKKYSVKKNSNILLAFYGDDFTGSTDALEFISRAGAKTVLFTEPPTTEQLKSISLIWMLMVLQAKQGIESR
jgi:hypothetical protein